MGRHVGISPSTVQRIWAKNDLKPHITKTFKFSNDPKFEEKFWDVIGLYLDPPTKALVLCAMRRASAKRSSVRSSGCRSHPGIRAP